MLYFHVIELVTCTILAYYSGYRINKLNAHSGKKIILFWVLCYLYFFICAAIKIYQVIKDLYK